MTATFYNPRLWHPPLTDADRKLNRVLTVNAFHPALQRAAERRQREAARTGGE